MAVVFDTHRNFAGSTVVTIPTPATSGNTLVVFDGTVFPTPPFNGSVYPSNAAPSPYNAEVFRCTALSGNSLTISRAQEGSTARAIIVGDLVIAGPTVKSMTDIETALNNSITDFLTTQVFS